MKDMSYRSPVGVAWKSALLTLTVLAVALPAVVYERGRVVASVLEKFLRSGEVRVDLGDLTGFRWTRVHFFGPYTDATVVERELGFRWDGFRRSSIGASDSAVLVVFVDGNRVIHWFDQSRADGDFVEAIRPGGYGPDDAVFRRERHGDRTLLVHDPEGVSDGLPVGPQARAVSAVG
jgi:hypothetical protein